MRSAVVSGGMTIATEARGVRHDDASRMAGQITERIVAFYERKGWL